MAKNLYLNAQDDQRFINYIKSMSTQDINPINEPKKNRILRKALLKQFDTLNMPAISETLI